MHEIAFLQQRINLILEAVMKTWKFAAALFAGAISTTNALGQSADPGAPPTSASAMSEGEVRKVDKEQAKMTLRHGPLHNLDMPAMTMVFKVADPKMLDLVKEGDKVKFTADKLNGAITVIAIQPVK